MSLLESSLALWFLILPHKLTILTRPAMTSTSEKALGTFCLLSLWRCFHDCYFIGCQDDPFTDW